MNEIVKKLLLAGDEFMPEIHLKQTKFTYSASELFIKSKERIKKSNETRDSSYIYQIELDKACLQHDMAQESFTDLNRRTNADKVLHYKVFNKKTPKYHGFQHGLASMVLKAFYVKASGRTVKNEINYNKEFAEELQKPIIRKFEKRKARSSFIDAFDKIISQRIQIFIKCQ